MLPFLITNRSISALPDVSKAWQIAAWKRLEVIYILAKYRLSKATLNTTQKALLWLVNNTIMCRVCLVSKPLNTANLFEPCRYDDGAKPGSGMWGNVAERGVMLRAAHFCTILHSSPLYKDFAH